MASVKLDFEEVVGSGAESIDMLNGKFTVTRIFKGPYLNRIKFAKTFINQVARGSLFGGTIRLPFQEHPKHQGIYATAVDIKGSLGADNTPVGEDDETIFKYNIATVTVKYQALPFAQPNSGEGPTHDGEENPLFDYIEETSDAGVELLQIPGEDVVCGGGNQFDQGPQNFISVLINFNIRQPFVASPHWDQMLANAGKVNRDLFFTPAGKVAVAGKVMYQGWSDNIKIDALGPRNFMWDITHKFVYNRIGWHNKWCVGGFQELNPHLYEDGDLMQIFFGAGGGGPNADLINDIEAAQDAIDAKQIELDAAIAADDIALVDQLSTELQVLVNERNQLIADAGGTLLTQQPGLED